MIIDLSLWACQITGLESEAYTWRNDVMRSRMNASRCTLVYTHAFTRAVRSGGNGSVRVCFAPEQIVADMQMRGTFHSYFQIVIKDGWLRVRTITWGIYFGIYIRKHDNFKHLIRINVEYSAYIRHIIKNNYKFFFYLTFKRNTLHIKNKMILKILRLIYQKIKWLINDDIIII